MSSISASTSGIEKTAIKLSLDFLQGVWLYASNDANCYAIVVIGESVEYKHFCLSEYKDYDGLFRAVKRYLNRIEQGKHVYFQVLPLVKKPEKGRGSERDVKVGRWLWVDFDYKEVVDKPSFEGCRELEDHA
ncbi:MAG: hypothetical protein QW456_10285, partial [Ignisphaera sp.]